MLKTLLFIFFQMLQRWIYNYQKGLFIFLQKGTPHPYVPENVLFTFLMLKKLLK